ncbi:arginine deiminase [Ureibacillus sp. FSL K6-8385]|uniref:Arginine deiminase n=1 Tax=Ureibacillus terrenus TaxID=118246 RepID=A0A540V513_9BACL|nr:arginine deiminase [Ureibacillus terrenus]MED3763936.1 arginine deiminase [Ureibacillus terrenus]TQE91839.1 arginine deiminase [Ureibacillus terrenus]
MKNAVNVTSEIGKLQTVLLHRPGEEVENLTPEYLQRLLFDDIPYLPIIQKEHDVFAETLRENEIEVLYLTDLLSEALHSEEIKEQFVHDILTESKISVDDSFYVISEYLLSFDTPEMIKKIIAGVRKDEIEHIKKKHLYEILTSHYPFYLDPMPNLYFTRDPAAVVGNGLAINKMREPARQRESLFIDYIVNYHPRFKNQEIPIWFNRDFDYPLEGGDVLVLSKDTIAIGISARTAAKSIERFALNLFNNQNSVKRVLAVEIPKSRAYMHLDTVFTMIDVDKFTIHSAIQDSNGEMDIYVLGQGSDPETLNIAHKTNLLETLKEVLELKEILLIPCGGGDIIAGPREQWNDGSNTLAIAPGKVITYDRNYVTNQLLRENGIEVIEVPSSELSRGRGGPRCMSMPLVRKDLE